MTARPSSPPERPDWPLKMTAQTAADYLDFRQKHPAQAFRAAVKRGVYPPPVHEPGEPPKWVRDQIDEWVRRRYAGNDNAEDEWDVA